MGVFIEYIKTITETLENVGETTTEQRDALADLVCVLGKKYGRDWVINKLDRASMGDSAQVIQQIHIEIERGQANRPS